MTEKATRHSLDELKHRKGKTDWTRVGNTSDTETQRQVDSNPDDDCIPTEEELKEFKPAEEGQIHRKAGKSKYGAPAFAAINWLRRTCRFEEYFSISPLNSG